MTRKQRRITLVISAVVVLGAAAGLVLTALEDSIVFFHSPSDVKEKSIATGTRIRLGGLVEEGSIVKVDGLTINFKVTDLAETVPVSYTGVLPDLFRDGQGVVTEGAFNSSGTFVADTVLAKHDENYMPPEVAESLKEAGIWKGGKPVTGKSE